MTENSSDASAPSVVVLGSINMDLVARCAALPKPGETLTANSFAEIPGGKGANQAVAASRAGGLVTMIGRVGDDGFAERLRANLAAEDICCHAVQTTDQTPSGVALINVSDAGDNQIVVVPGANGMVSCCDVDQFADQIKAADVLLVQMEIPQDVVISAIRLARSAGTRVILDPAPAPVTISEGLLEVDLICPNETEAAALTGLPLDTTESIEAAARRLHHAGAQAVVITLGDQGVVLFDGDTFSVINAIPINAVDATAAGDALAGAIAVRWAESDSLQEAVRFGNAAGAIAASRPGAQPSLPTRSEIEQSLSESNVNS